MSSMCTCHIDKDSCEWCRVTEIEDIFFGYREASPDRMAFSKPKVLIDDVLWLVDIAKEAMLAEVKREVAHQILEEPQYSPVEFLKKLEGWENRCGSCKFFNDTTGECRKRNIFVKTSSPSCPQWRYFA